MNSPDRSSALTSIPWRPTIFDPSDAEDRGQLDELVSSGRVFQTSDTLQMQLRDLAKARCPADDCESDGVDEILAGVPLSEYGRWVYYPWSGRLVRLLPPDEFRELRLDRNRPKSVPKETSRLVGFTVGIAGLSVGNVIALTLALEGTVGHIRLADFDTLELSNMNRIRAGVHDIGLAKPVIAAQQIAELDPYLGVSVLGGIEADTIEKFMLGGPELGPPLNALIDQCDSMNTKFLLRQWTRSLRLPVVMNTSDRGMLDIERFDLEPARPFLHGRTGDAPDVGEGGFREGDDAEMARKYAAVLRFFNEDGMSANLGAAFVELGSTISSWPQLASDVVLGGAAVTTAVRCLALGTPLPSGRRYLDLDTSVREPSPAPKATRPAQLPRAGLAHVESTTRAPELVRYLVDHAVLAPSSGNRQPWHFYWNEDRIWVAHDRERSESIMDPHGRAARLALGAAVENMVIAATARGLAVTVQPFPRSDVVAEITTQPDASAPDSLFGALRERRTHRAPGTRSTLTAEEIAELTAPAKHHGAQLDLSLSPDELDELGGIVGACDRIRLLNPHLHEEAVGELRFGPAPEARDGITLESLALPTGLEEPFRVITRTDIAARLRYIGGGARFADYAKIAVAGASAMVLLSIDNDTPESWLAGGRAMQRTWLRAEQLGLGLHPMTSPIHMFEMLDGPSVKVFNAAEAAELRELRARFHKVMPKPNGPMALLFRLTRITGPATRSLRLPAESVLTPGLP
ncbi:nitroreductase [Kibdelosporangium banguiense]|uniref:Nitroreductase n=1 Tax=Kibdelosporangium banguiense TaxID=1365924 RepID=A0ABS4TRA9_9PSEU|nr:Rv1355c family protein [Kibdelosporangium banguiense]MBP2326937.1 nitroreductase [Kibdelosporangium banguiense]